MRPISLLPRLLAICLGLFHPLFGLPLEGTATIITIAGGTGDGGIATAVPLNLPQAVAVDNAGNLYLTDTYYNRIRKVDSAGLITTVAGNGSDGFGGDGGPATAAELSGPSGVAVDSTGNLYIADTYNNRIRKVDPAGLITTVAGNGDYGFGGDGGPATAARLSYPSSVAADGLGNLYLTDAYSHRVRKVNRLGIITTVAGNGNDGFGGDGGPATAAELNYPSGVAADGAGNLYIADAGNHRIHKVDPNGTITTVAGNGNDGFGGDGGPATAATLSGTFTVAVDGAGNLFIPDSFNHRIRKVDRRGIITTVAGNGNDGFGGDGGPAAAASLSLYGASGIAVDNAGILYFADVYNYRIRKVDPAGIITTVAGNGTAGFGGDGAQATAASLFYPGDTAVDGAGNLYIADTLNDRIRKVDSAGIITTVAGNGTRDYGGDGGPATAASLNGPEDVAIDPAGNLYIADSFNYRIRKVDPNGIITTVAGNGSYGFGGDGAPATAALLSRPGGIAVDDAGNLYIADTNNARILKMNPKGRITTVAGNGTQGYGGDGGPATAAALHNPRGVTVDRTGNLYIAEPVACDSIGEEISCSGNNRIRKVDPAGIITTVAGNGTAGFGGDGGPATEAALSTPNDVAADDAGNLYIADSGNHRIRKVDPAGLISTLAGEGTAGFGGDGGPAAAAHLYFPSGVTADNAGNLYIADSGNGRIRKVGNPSSLDPNLSPDLNVSLMDSPDPVQVGSRLAYTAVIVNHGRARASAVTVTLSRPDGLRWVSADHGCRPVGNTAECRLGDMEPGARAERSLVVIPTRVGDIDAGASLSANEIDFNPIDNVARAVTAVTPTQPGMAVPPIADAGPEDFAVPLGRKYRLNGTASLDPNTGAYKKPLRFLWSAVSGPGNARFSLANRKTAVASFVPPLPGDYTFDLQASNDNGTSHSQLTIHVIGEIRVMAPVAGEVWRLGHPQTITWSTRGIPFTKTVSIFLENAGGKSYLLKSRVRSGKGVYIWKSRNDSRKYLSEQARIRVCLRKIGRNPPVCGESEGGVVIGE